MEKIKELITESMQEFELTPEDMVDFWLKNGMLSPMFLKNAEKYEDSLEVYPGWYAFEGYRFSPNPEAYPNRQGVVSFVDMNAPKGKRIGVLLPKRVMKTCYHPQAVLLGANDENDGLKNSLLIGIEKDGFDVTGISPNDLFRPAKMQGDMIAENLDAVNSALEKIDGDLLYDFSWLSTEIDEKNAWAINFGAKTLIMMNKQLPLGERRMFLL